MAGWSRDVKSSVFVIRHGRPEAVTVWDQREVEEVDRLDRREVCVCEVWSKSNEGVDAGCGRVDGKSMHACHAFAIRGVNADDGTTKWTKGDWARPRDIIHSKILEKSRL